METTGEKVWRRSWWVRWSGSPRGTVTGPTTIDAGGPAGGASGAAWATVGVGPAVLALAGWGCGGTGGERTVSVSKMVSHSVAPHESGYTLPYSLEVMIFSWEESS